MTPRSREGATAAGFVPFLLTAVFHGIGGDMSAALHLVDEDRCGAPTKSGRPCRRQAGPGGRCGQHSKPEPDRASVKGAAAGTRRDLLTALRDKIASDIDEGVPARDLASLSKRLLDISKELEEVSTAEDGDGISTAAATPDEPWSG